ncbi:MAG: chorismate mutase [Anaerolineales bacterium]
MPIRGIRGATIAPANTPDAIRCATRELLSALASANQLDPADIASVIFTATPDLTAEAPARAARELGWDEVALLCMSEMPTADGLPRCIRVLIHWNTEKAAAEVRHVYLHDAAQLRPDRVGTNPLSHS